MAKKKIGNLSVDTETGEVLPTETSSKYENVNPETGGLKKKFSKLSDYKAKIKFEDAKFKPQGWIDMSPAFKDVTKLPGIPTGHLIMNYGKSDTGKSTMGLEAASYAQKQGILPVFIITENKFSFERGETMGINFDEAIVFNGVKTLEEGCKYIQQTIADQEAGNLPYDIFFVWDSIGATPSEKEFKKQEEGEGGGGMMVASRVIRENISRNISHRINNSRNEKYPFTNTLLIINHAYQAPPSPPATIGTLVPYGGDGIYYSATLVFRTGGIMSRSSKVTATKDGTELAFAIKSALVVEKNHITNVATTKGKILCTDHGFCLDDKESIDEYKKTYKDGWDLKYDLYWSSVAEN